MVRQCSFLSATLSCLAVLIFGQLPVAAQGQQVEQPLSKLFKSDLRTVAVQLGLSNEQVAKIDAINQTRNDAANSVLTTEQQHQVIFAVAVQKLQDITQSLGAIKLTPEQKSKAQALLVTMKQATLNVAKQVKPTVENKPDATLVGDIQKQLLSIWQNYSQKIMALLTPEQIEQLQSPCTVSYRNLQQMQPFMPGMSREQISTIRNIQQGAITQASEICDNVKLSEKKKTEKMKVLFDETLKKIIESLPPEQQQKEKSHLIMVRQDPMLGILLTEAQQLQMQAISEQATQDILHVLTEKQRSKLQKLIETQKRNVVNER